MSAYETIRYKKTGTVATMTLHRPEHKNGMTLQMLLDMNDVLAAVAKDADIRVLILTGTGSYFCPGADLQAQADPNRPDRKAHVEDFRAPVLLHEMEAVTIAAINGACAGGGLAWAAACDLRFAATSARFNTAYLDVGVGGDHGGVWTLSRILGPAKARELFFLPDKFGAEEAHRIGLVSRVFPDAKFDAEVAAIGERLAATSPLALRAMKANFLSAEQLDYPAYVKLETERILPLFDTHDTREAFLAKLEKRKPRFLGR